MSYDDAVARGWQRDAIANAGALREEVLKRKAAEEKQQAAEARAAALQKEVDFLWAVVEGERRECDGECYRNLLP